MGLAAASACGTCCGAANHYQTRSTHEAARDPLRCGTLFPVNGSHFDKRLGGVAMACSAALVVAGSGARTLARHRYA